ncbi:MAG: YbaB/EbfC family nucleoid-associated protein [Pygmaiobacter massiliensis]|nr:YbaB/EbfC family nucleoid-associated protein [Pygmaiobacter massiliensis]
MKARLPQGYGKQDRSALIAQYQKMQQDMEALTSDLEAREHTVTAGGGQIELTMDGKFEVRSIKIKPEMVDPDDVEMLEDLIAAAVNEGVRVVRETQENEMNTLTSGFNLPGGLSL